MSEPTGGRPVHRTLPVWMIAVVSIAVVGLGALLGGSFGLATHGIPYGGCSGFYPATCGYAFRAGALVGALGGVSIAGALVWRRSERGRGTAMLAAGVCAILAIPLATYLVARTDPANHETDFGRMLVWVGAIAVVAAAIAWLIAASVGRITSGRPTVS